MIREDLIETIAETYSAAEPAGAEPTAYLHCTRGPIAWEPEAATRARDERIAGAVLARGLFLGVAPSFVQLLAMLPAPCFAVGVTLLYVRHGANFARVILSDWPHRPGFTLTLLVLQPQTNSRFLGRIDE
jgi:hypothetical protein